MLTDAEGPFICDRDGNRYLDLASQLVNINIGHQNPAVIAAIQEQAARCARSLPNTHANEARSEAARLITERTPGDLNCVFFTNGGADANEHAVRMDRLYTGRHKVMTTYRSYHGGAVGSTAMTVIQRLS